MAKMPAQAAAPKPADEDDQDDDEDEGMDASGADEGDESGQDEGDEDQGNVLFTVMEEDDGTYRLIKGDEDDEGEGDEEGAEGESGEDEGQTFDSKGALLKGILDLLNEKEDSAGAPGSSEDQFQSGFGAGAPATPMAQKY